MSDSDLDLGFMFLQSIIICFSGGWMKHKLVNIGNMKSMAWSGIVMFLGKCFTLITVTYISVGR